MANQKRLGNENNSAEINKQAGEVDHKSEICSSNENRSSRIFVLRLLLAFKILIIAAIYNPDAILPKEKHEMNALVDSRNVN